MAEHSPEPWEVVDDYGHVKIRDRDQRRIVSEMYGRDEDEANARRIVACVNFATGVSTEWLESHSLSTLMSNSSKIEG